jgi:hypothetical protein
MLGDERYKALATLALRAALEAPIHRAPFSTEARVRWSTIEAIREEAGKLGIDWMAVHPAAVTRAATKAGRS